MTTHWDMREEDLAKELLGQTVKSIDTDYNTLTLCNGTVLEFVDTSDCCAWFSAELIAGNLTNNAVTSVDIEYGREEDFKLHIIAADDRIATVAVDGDSSSGYYVHGINLVVREKK